eukprot:EC723333.1.p1 GENE.EC723333.1~~EC723333.1.p1  ORF type:complete len:169 (+),score=11.92 EC723333.1:99-605(+)
MSTLTLLELPGDCLSSIFVKLPPIEIFRLSEICRTFRDLVEDEALWQEVAVSTLNLSPQASSETQFDSWKFLCRHHLNYGDICGTWSELWSNVRDIDSIVMQSDPTNKDLPLKITMNGEWTVWDVRRLPDGAISFHCKGGGSGWSFEYTFRRTDDRNVLSLHVFRTHE